MNPPPHRPTIPHLPALDGLRGIAVLGVLFFHADKLLRGGYLGVDLFFVLSGFLITSILIAEFEGNGHINLRLFWIRRARRLFPALLSLMPAVALYAFLFADSHQLTRIRNDALATLAYVANWREIFSARSYWDLFAAPSPLEHTWSLAIEEQFYVLWPLLVVGIFSLFRKSVRALLLVSLALAIASAAAMWFLFLPENTSRAYFGTDTRGGAILLGAALAAILSQRKNAPSPNVILAFDVLGAASVVVLGVAWARLDGQSPFLYRGGFWVSELCVLVIIVCATHGQASVIAKALSWKPFVWAGLLSYGIYLWHWPLFVVLDGHRIPSLPVRTLVRFGITLLVAMISFRVLEQPIRKRGVPFGKPWIIVPLAVSIAVTLVLVATKPAAATAINGQQASVDRHSLPPAETLPPGTLRILVVGDSVAEALGERLHFVQSDLTVVAERGVGDCSILEDVVPTHSLTNEKHHGGNCAAKWKSDVEELRPDTTLVVLGGGFFAPAQVAGAWQLPCESGWQEVYTKQIVRRLQEISSAHGQVIVVKVPYPVEGWRSPGILERVDCFNRALEDASRASPPSVVLDLQSHLCPGTECAMKSQGELIRPDGLHFQGLGAEETARWVLRETRRLATKSTPD